MRQFMMKVLFKREWITFIWMGVFFVAFGVSSLNLFMLFKANFALYLEHGAMVIGDGALRQLVELIGYGYLSLLFYLLFKACERVLVERLTQGGGRGNPPGEHESLKQAGHRPDRPQRGNQANEKLDCCNAAELNATAGAGRHRPDRDLSN